MANLLASHEQLIRLGSTVQIKSEMGSDHYFGVVTETHTDRANAEPIAVNIMSFGNGLPFTYEYDLTEGRIKIASLHQLLEHLDGIAGNLKACINKDGLVGAVAARREHYLQGVIDKLTRKPEDEMDRVDIFYGVTVRPEDPKTGVYVLEGDYSGLMGGESCYLAGLIVTPRLRESTVSRLMFDMYPKGFGSISERFLPVHGTLVGYSVYEVPKNALGLVENPTKVSCTPVS